ncbi:MAG: DUF3144 domain-containing protein [Methylotenera sp.]|nr:DUF3144 domain-containing protein [Methylotenera sp.]MDO9389815.1 DUF3144 domain-containing protein [Methylotenera sp.]MDP1595598.1 DUF3144 domain-containing protein [Methylotenera sp.]MDP1755048.1 DUF3144 domain-containing protein [Methylotenera sp.]MDP1960163.1 DUF3144 domain-containing protein [Methylotenera sp.]
MVDNKLIEPGSPEAKPDEAFWGVADAFIASANEQATAVDRGVVSAGFAYASARFNAFVIASQCGSKESFEAEKSAAIDYFVNQYKLALTENVADYQANFDTYINNNA